MTPSRNLGHAPFSVLRGGGQADLHPPFWVGLSGEHFQSYEWIGPGPEPLRPVTPEPEPLVPITTLETGAESHATCVTARVRSLITCPGPVDTREETRPAVVSAESEADKGIWIDIRCSDPALLTTLSLSLGDMVTITRREPSNTPEIAASSPVSPPRLGTDANFADICLSPVVQRMAEESSTNSFMASSPVVAFSSTPRVSTPAISLVSTPAFYSANSPSFSPAISPAISPANSTANSLAFSPAFSPANSTANSPAIYQATTPTTSHGILPSSSAVSYVIPPNSRTTVTSPLASLADLPSGSRSASPVTVTSSTPSISLARGMHELNNEME